jgi:hypothetical protein
MQVQKYSRYFGCTGGHVMRRRSLILSRIVFPLILAVVLVACGGNNPPPNPGGPFRITRIELPPIAWNTEEDMKIFWQGDPVAFPVTAKFKVTDCPTDSNCDGLAGDEVFEEYSNPLVEDAYCNSTDPSSPPVSYFYEMHLFL